MYSGVSLCGQRLESFRRAGHRMEYDRSSQDCEAPEFLRGLSLLGKPKGTAGLFTKLSQGWVTGVRPLEEGS